MLIGAIGAGAITQIADALTTQGQTRFPAPDGNTQAATTQSLTAPQPPNGETAISKASAKIIADLKSLLLSVQAQQSDPNPTTPDAGKQPGTQAASRVTTA